MSNRGESLGSISRGITSPERDQRDQPRQSKLRAKAAGEIPSGAREVTAKILEFESLVGSPTIPTTKA